MLAALDFLRFWIATSRLTALLAMTDWSTVPNLHLSSFSPLSPCGRGDGGEGDGVTEARNQSVIGWVQVLPTANGETQPTPSRYM